MSRGASVSVIVGLLGGLSIGAILMLLATTAIFFTEPTKILEAHENTSVTQQGSVLEINYKVVRRQTCNSWATIWLWKWLEGDELHPRRQYVVPLRISVIPWSDVSPLLQEFTVAEALPRQVTPGQWYLRVRYLDYCAFLAEVFGPTPRQAPDVPITITPYDRFSMP